MDDKIMNDYRVHLLHNDYSYDLCVNASKEDILRIMKIEYPNELEQIKDKYK